MKLSFFYFAMMILGTILPWLFFFDFLSNYGMNMPLFWASFFANSASSGLSVDFLMSVLVFWVWSYSDSRKKGVRAWPLVLLSTVCVGLSLALPLYFYLRHRMEANYIR